MTFSSQRLQDTGDEKEFAIKPEYLVKPTASTNKKKRFLDRDDEDDEAMHYFIQYFQTHIFQL